MVTKLSEPTVYGLSTQLRELKGVVDGPSGRIGRSVRTWNDEEHFLGLNYAIQCLSHEGLQMCFINEDKREAILL